MKNLLKRLRKWNENRLDNSACYDVLFVMRNPINAAVFRQTAKAFGIPYKEGTLRVFPDARVCICPDCGYNDRFYDFLMAIDEKCRWPVQIRHYLLFKAQLWKFDAEAAQSSAGGSGRR